MVCTRVPCWGPLGSESHEEHLLEADDGLLWVLISENVESPSRTHSLPVLPWTFGSSQHQEGLAPWGSASEAPGHQAEVWKTQGPEMGEGLHL